MMIVTFLVLTLLHAPLMYLFSTYSNYRNQGNASSDSYTKVTSIGNMGFSQAKCMHIGLGVDKMIL